MERARVCPLAWGSVAQQTGIQERMGLFDVIIGADVVYAAEAVEDLFTTVQALLSLDENSRVLLCYIVRRVSEQSLHASASRHGFEVLNLDAALAVAAEQVTGQDPFRFMLLKRKQ